MSRADIARQLGLTRATIGHAIALLVDAGLVAENGEPLDEAKRKGRPGVGVQLDATGAYFVGVDIGTKVLTYVLVDLQQNVVARIAEPSGRQFKDPEAIYQRIVPTTKKLIKQARIRQDRIEGICVSVPGIVGRDGRVVNAPFLEWRDFPLREKLVAQCDRNWSVVVCNDAFAFANAERAVEASSEMDNLFLVLLAEGIGGALVDEGRVANGSHGYAGEVGHTVISVRGKVDTFEMHAGAKFFVDLIKPDQAVADGVADILKRAASRKVADSLDVWAEGLAEGLANAIHLLDPRRIVLGGPIAALFPLREQRVSELLARRLLPGFQVPQISVARFGPDGAAIGAAATIRETMFVFPEIEGAMATI